MELCLWHFCICQVIYVWVLGHSGLSRDPRDGLFFIGSAATDHFLAGSLIIFAYRIWCKSAWLLRAFCPKTFTFSKEAKMEGYEQTTRSSFSLCHNCLTHLIVTLHYLQSRQFDPCVCLAFRVNSRTHLAFHWV